MGDADSDNRQASYMGQHDWRAVRVPVLEHITEKTNGGLMSCRTWHKAKEEGGLS